MDITHSQAYEQALLKERNIFWKNNFIFYDMGFVDFYRCTPTMKLGRRTRVPRKVVNLAYYLKFSGKILGSLFSFRRMKFPCLMNGFGIPVSVGRVNFVSYTWQAINLLC